MNDTHFPLIASVGHLLNKLESILNTRHLEHSAQHPQFILILLTLTLRPTDPELWNKLPNDIRSCYNPDHFKHNLKMYLFKNYHLSKKKVYLFLLLFIIIVLCISIC